MCVVWWKSEVEEYHFVFDIIDIFIPIIFDFVVIFRFCNHDGGSLNRKKENIIWIVPCVFVFVEI